MPAIPDGVPLLDVTEYPDRVELVWRQFPKKHRRASINGGSHIILGRFGGTGVYSTSSPDYFQGVLSVPGTTCALDDRVVRIPSKELPVDLLPVLIAWVRSEGGGVRHRIDHGNGLGGSTATDGSYTRVLPDVVVQEPRADDPYTRIEHDGQDGHLVLDPASILPQKVRAVAEAEPSRLAEAPAKQSEGACRFHLPLPPSAFGADPSLDSLSLLHVTPDDDEEDTQEHELEMLDEIESAQRAHLQRVLKAWPRCERHSTPLDFYLDDKADDKGVGRFFFTCPYGEDD